MKTVPPRRNSLPSEKRLRWVARPDELLEGPGGDDDLVVMLGAPPADEVEHELILVVPATDIVVFDVDDDSTIATEQGRVVFVLKLSVVLGLEAVNDLRGERELFQGRNPREDLAECAILGKDTHNHWNIPLLGPYYELRLVLYPKTVNQSGRQ